MQSRGEAVQMRNSAKERFGRLVWALFGMLLLLAAPNAALAGVTIEDGDYVSFGAWKHATNDGGGYEAESQPILWKKLNDNLYLSQYLLDAHSWHTTSAMPEGDWQGSGLRAWLNGTFYSGAFGGFGQRALADAPDGDSGVYVTIPDTTASPVVGGQSLYGRLRYKANKNSANGSRYWLRRRFNASTTQAWGVGIYGLQGGDAVLTDAIGIAPIIALKPGSFVLKHGAGTEEVPYALYGTSDAMKPAALSVDGDKLRLVLGTAVEALGTLPAAADFSLKKNGEDAAIAAVQISSDDARVLVLTLGEAAKYGDALTLSYVAATDSSGLLTGGAVRAQDDCVVLVDFDALSMQNETAPTQESVSIVPSALRALAHRGFSATVSVTNATGGEITVDAVTPQNGWDRSGLSYRLGGETGDIVITGFPETPGTYTLNVDVTIAGVAISGNRVEIAVDPTGTDPAAGNVVITSDRVGPAVLREETSIVYTVTSTIQDAHVKLNAVKEGNGWSFTGLSFARDAANNTFTVSGIPTQTGTYGLLVDVEIDGVMIRDKELSLEIVYPQTDPTSADIRIAGDLEGNLMVGRTADFTYTVSSSIKDAEVVLESVTGGRQWGQSGLVLVPNLPGRTVAVRGTPETAGTYEVLFDVKIDGVLFKDQAEHFVVENQPTAADIVITPEMPHAKAYRPFSATVTVGTSANKPVVLNGVSRGTGWDDSNLSVGFDGSANTVTVSGMPTQPGVYTLKLNVAIGDVQVTNGVLTVTVEPADSAPGYENILITSDSTEYFVVGEAASATYTVSSGIENAHVELGDVQTGPGWKQSGLGVSASGADRTFTVSGTPEVAGRYEVVMDVRIDGVLLTGHTMTIVVRDPDVGPSETIEPSAVYLDSAGLYIPSGASAGLSWIIAPSNATERDVHFDIDAPEVATVDANGLVTANAPGKAVVTITTANGLSDTVVVIVEPVKTVRDIVNYWTVDPGHAPYHLDETVTVRVNMAREPGSIDIAMVRPDGSTEDIKPRFDVSRRNVVSAFKPDRPGLYTSMMTIHDDAGGEVYTKRIALTVVGSDGGTPGGSGGSGGGCNSGALAIIPLAVLAAALYLTGKRGKTPQK